MGLTCKENNRCEFFFILVQQQQLLAVLSTVSTSNGQGRVRPDQRNSLKLTWKFSCRVMIAIKFWAERKSYFFCVRHFSLFFHSQLLQGVYKNNSQVSFTLCKIDCTRNTHPRRMWRGWSGLFLPRYQLGSRPCERGKKVKLIAKTRYPNTAQTRLPKMLLRGPQWCNFCLVCKQSISF